MFYDILCDLIKPNFNKSFNQYFSSHLKNAKHQKTRVMRNERNFNEPIQCNNPPAMMMANRKFVSPLSIESILSKMTNNLISNYSTQESKLFDSETDSYNGNSFLSMDKQIADDSPKDENKEMEEISTEISKSEMETDHEACSIENKDTDDNNASIDGNYEIPEVNGVGQYCCHLCSFVCTIKEEFYVHLLTHYTYSCDQCDYASRTEGRLKRHIKDFHCANSPDNFSGQKVPSNNPKSLKCKHCSLISSSKEKHWNHQRTHLDVSKCLQCPKCPFITEYKHHLEYHIRNHEKIKPYKCSKCQYRCVNKSMLNSHKKSHSNVYQFRCADCSYASKYCHSLKQHLTRHGHQPAPVLNEDGSLPSYDNSSEILTMKRGPNNRTINIQTSISNSTDALSAFTPSTQTESSTKHDMSSAISAFSFFKREQMDSLLNLTMKQYYSNSMSRNMLPPFVFVPPFSNMMQFPMLPLMPRENLTSNFSCQNSALDLTTKPKQQLSNNQNVETQECLYCRIQFRDPNLLNIHVSYHSRLNPLLCNKCGVVSNNIIDFLKHVEEKPH